MKTLAPALLAVVWGPCVHGQEAPVALPTVMGRIVWADHDLSRAQVRVYADRALTRLVDQFGTGGPTGTFCLVLDPGEYYLMALVDANANGKLDEGDGLGFYGVTQFGAAQEPKALTVVAGAMVGDAAIPITASLDPGGKPAALRAEAAPAAARAATLSGRITEAEGLTAPIFVLLLAPDRAPLGLAALTAAEPTFELTAAPGDRLLLAIADVSGDGKLGAGDRVGAWGVPDWAQAPAELPKLTAASGAQMGGLDIALTGRLDAEGVVSPAQGKGAFRLDLAALPAILAGTVPYPAAATSPVQVRLSADPSLSRPVAATECRPGAGSFALAVAPGAYYLTAVVDENGDGRLGPGDALGFYGVTSLAAGTAPAPLTVGPAAIAAGLSIPVTIRLNEEGKPVPLAPAAGNRKQN